MKSINFISCLLIVLLFFISSCFSVSSNSNKNEVFTKNPNRGMKYHIFISDSSSEEQIQEVLFATNIWKTVISDQKQILNIQDPIVYNKIEFPQIKSICDEKNTIITVEFISGTTFVDYLFNNFGTLGKTTYLDEEKCKYRNIKILTGQIDLASQNRAINQTMVIVHELGHSFSIGHVKNKESVMSEIYPEYLMFITQHDIINLCLIYSCTDKELSKMMYMHLPEE